ncbi:glycoside hydrolase family 99-like domain-containing protein [Phyllobacterium sp. OV277]|uniref:glycosyltransferase WbsX family protein n=1 Tax=Phyllobacterium sp. OV277 TaxID=1882772 RepID=UPI001AECD407|nr:glycoside hydrolase family 99-like domain-containing protein [Phyllobacterium sp. OV277]
MTELTTDASFMAFSGLNESGSHDTAVVRDASKLIAFYLPQFHRVAENSEWWGPGFTEWMNVARGRPNFVGHYQPHIPRELGFYDLSQTAVIAEQAELARLYGIHGFCFYHYWFSGRRILERPAENFLKSDININFCLCWANENWTRTWDGDTKSVLLEQKYAEDDAENFIESLIEYFQDSRYIKVNGKPLLVVYRAKQIPDPKKTFAKWRELAKQHGFSDLHIAVVDFYDISSPEECAADALVEFPPHKFNSRKSVPENPPKVINPEFTGNLVDYHKMIAQSANRATPPFTLYRGIIPSWDNTARRQNTPTIVVNANPDLYQEWLSFLRTYTRQESKGAENFIFINAWNEWGEGCHLEPDQKWGLSYLAATLRSSFYHPSNPATESLAAAREALFAKTEELILVQHGKQITDEAEARATGLALARYRPPNPIVQQFSAILIKWPFVHRIAKRVYSMISHIRG